MRFVSLSTPLRLVASAAVAGALSMQPLSSFAQSAPVSPPASCTVPVLDLANPAPGQMLLPGAYTIQGAALDPQAEQGSGIDQVSFFLGDRNSGGLALGMAQPDKGPRLDDFSVTVTLPSTDPGEHQFTAYARSWLTGRETQISFPVVLGEDPAKSALNRATETESSTNPAVFPSGCEPLQPAAATPAAPLISVAAPGTAFQATGIAAAEAYATAVQAQVPDASNEETGDLNQQ